MEVVSNPAARPENERMQAVGDFICADGRRMQAAASLFRSGALGEITSEVAGMSMGSTIPHGAQIRIAPGAPPYLRGTVIAFVAGGKTVVHRIRWQRRWGRGRHFVITQGDGMILPDMPVERAAVLGPVTAVRRNGAWSPLEAAPVRPRRERVLSVLVFVGGATLLEIHPPLARWLLSALNAAERRHAWIRALLY
ncbi:MAG TPA: hypothetical protein VLW55_12600 [Burkholderiaceae bacterium]|nr:hypothetical protein [Burkholderiaceae bacterium]